MPLPLEQTRPYLFLDAGGTLDYPNLALIGAVAGELGFSLTEDELLSAFQRTIFRMDEALRDHRPVPWAGRLVETVVDEAGVDAGAASRIVKEARLRSGSKSLWTYTRPWVSRALQKLHEAGYRISVISNADGTVQQQMTDLGFLPSYLDRVFDSALIGYEKPDPRLFQFALNELGLDAGSALYVGDLVMVDVLGANRAGLGAVHLDGAGLYAGWPGLHFPNLEAVADALLAGQIRLDDPRLFPFAAP